MDMSYVCLSIDLILIAVSIYVVGKLKSFGRLSIDNNITIEQLNIKFDAIRSSLRFIKLDNLITMTTTLARYREGIYEDEYFIQEVGECKVLKITDKSNGEITRIEYDISGQIEQTSTYKDDLLLLTMEYVNGQLATGNKYNQNTQKAFSYQYNEIGEVVSQHEYLYDENNRLLTIKEMTL